MALDQLPRFLTSVQALTSLILITVTVSLALPLHRRNDDMAKGEKAKSVATDMGSVVDCPSGHYFSEVDMVCKPCSGCPVNQIIRKPCSTRADTWCGPFFEFDKFHQTAVEKTSEKDSKKDGSARGHSQASRSPESGEDDLRLIGLKAGEQWRTLSFALITVLSFICCLVVVVGLYVYIIFRRSQNQKLIFRGPELLAPYPDMDPEPRYVETFVTSRDRIRSSRHQPIYQHICTGDGVSLFPPLTSSACDVKTEEVVEQLNQGEHDYIYINMSAMDSRDS